MASSKTRALAIFVVSAVILALVFFILPINIFDGQIDYKTPTQEYTLDVQLSLSYFIGLGYDEVDMQNVADFRLTTKGLVMAFIFILGFPALLAYRIYMKSKRS